MARGLTDRIAELRGTGPKEKTSLSGVGRRGGYLRDELSKLEGSPDRPGCSCRAGYETDRAFV